MFQTGILDQNGFKPKAKEGRWKSFVTNEREYDVGWNPYMVWNNFLMHGIVRLMPIFGLRSLKGTLLIITYILRKLR